jgi:hypothetical protein
VTSSRRLSLVAGVSLAYDVTAGVMLFFFTGSMAGWFATAVPDPVLFAKLNGLFLMAVGLGYAGAIRRPEAHRTYLWIFGHLLKGAGAVTFITDHFQHGSPPAFLLFAATDAILAGVTLAALLAPRQVSGPPAA